MDDERNLEIVRNIWAILRTAPEIVMSWGLDPATVKPVEYGLGFHVQGFKHTGPVVVKLNEGADLYEVYLYDESGNVKEQHLNIYCDQLVDVIDQAVEYTGSDYKDQVSAAYPGLENVQQIVVM